MNKTSQAGQVGLIVLLTMVVLLTVGASVASRSVSESRLARQEEETSRTFGVAEAGVEEALGGLDEFIAGPETQKQGSIQVGDPGKTVNLNYQVDKLNVFEARVEQGQSADVTVTGGGGNSLVLEWGQNQACPDVASMVVAIFSQSGGVSSVRRATYAKCARTDNFTTTGIGAGSDGYSALVSIPILANDVLVRIRPVYVSTMVRASGSWLPVQGYAVKSVASSVTNNETRAIELKRSVPVAPSVFDYVVFSGTALSK